MNQRVSVNEPITDRIARHYAGLSERLREAADYVAANPVDMASRSLRAVAAASGISPATFSRLARALDYASVEELREVCRAAARRPAMSFAERAGRLRAEAGDGANLFDRQAGACIANIVELQQTLTRARLEAAVSLLQNARQVVLFGAFGSTGIVEYMAYLANYFTNSWTLAGRMGASLGSVLAGVAAGDVLLVVTKAPYARRAVVACETARAQGADTLVITDSHSCPALAHASASFIVPSDSPQFFSSYAATLVLMETLIAMLVARSPEDISARIREVELRNRGLGEFWSE